MFAVKVALIARENNQRVVELLCLLESFEDSSESFICGGENAQAIANGFVAGSGFMTERRDTFEFSLQGWFAFARAGDVFAVRHLGVGVEILMTFRWNKVPGAWIGKTAIGILHEIRMNGFV